TLLRRRKTGSSVKPLVCAAINNPLQYRKLGDSDLNISEITLGTMTFGEQNTEKESHDILNYAFDNGINALDTAEA
ncbi:aldo-keto reductase-like, partial [Trifolium medium]|nr:aldo-keto reductase-like [Trifolium medium]